MSKTSEQKSVASAKRKKNELDQLFPIVEVSKLSLDDKFLQFVPATGKQKRLKESIIWSIKSGMPDFRRPIMDPSVDENGNIFYEEGKMPAIGHSANWWYRKVPKFMPDKNSRIGSEKQYNAFLGVLIKELVEEHGYNVVEAWMAVCEDSCDLGHYCNLSDKKHCLDRTGSRKIGKWCDLANTCKIIKRDKAYRFLLAGGAYFYNSDNYPLAGMDVVQYPDCNYYNSVGWIVLDV